MEAIEIARKLAALNQTKEACQAYTLAVQQETDPAARMEAVITAFPTPASGIFTTQGIAKRIFWR